MVKSPFAVRLQPKYIAWFAAMAEKSGWSRGDILEQLIEYANRKKFSMKRRPPPKYLEKAVKKYGEAG